jgi:transaldolase
MFIFDKNIEEKILSIKTKIFADGADLNSMLELNKLSYIKGLTTNPTLMKKAGINNYETFAKNVLENV